MKLENIDSRLEAPGVAISANPEISREALEEAVPVAYMVNESDEAEPAASHSVDGCKLHKGKRQCGGKRHKQHRFKGYTIDELRMNKVVSELKIAAAKDRLMMMVSPDVKGEVNTIKSCVRGFDTFMKYLDVALLAYGISRRVSRFFGKFSRRR